MKVYVDRECSVEGCTAGATSRGWCNVHYQRWKAHGDPNAEVQIRGNDPERFWRKVVKLEEGCWEWQAARDQDGYGSVWYKGAQWRAPRVAWLLANPGRQIPHGQVVRHKCDNPPCVNPSHLELGTPRDNDDDRVRRGRSAFGDRNGSRLYPERLARGPANVNYRPEECRNGHPADRRYVQESTGERICRDCKAAQARRYRAKKMRRSE